MKEGISRSNTLVSNHTKEIFYTNLSFLILTLFTGFSFYPILMISPIFSTIWVSVLQLLTTTAIIVIYFQIRIIENYKIQQIEFKKDSQNLEEKTNTESKEEK
ncbi:MAG: hypothetical protein ACTSUV_01000 [Candidatus Ranarchaeia archaeon]